MQPTVRASMVALLLSAIAACGSPRAQEARTETRPTSDDDRPYMHACAPDGSGQACDVDECVAWKRNHGEAQDDALAECLQDCNCGE